MSRKAIEERPAISEYTAVTKNDLLFDRRRPGSLPNKALTALRSSELGNPQAAGSNPSEILATSIHIRRFRAYPDQDSQCPQRDYLQKSTRQHVFESVIGAIAGVAPASGICYRSISLFFTDTPR